MSKHIFWRYIGGRTWREGWLEGRPAPGLVAILESKYSNPTVVSENEVEIKVATDAE